MAVMPNRSMTIEAGSGITLVELLVVIAIIGILVALMLPAIQAAREASRRANCLSNIRQVGLALLNYHTTHKKFPPSAIWGMGNVPNNTGSPLPASHHTWLTMILPYMEQAPLYDMIDFKERAWAADPNHPNRIAVGTMVSALRCPSDGSFTNPSETHGIAITNYVGSEGFHWWPLNTGAVIQAAADGTIVQPGDYSGVFRIETTHGLRQITDGSSNTIIVSEASDYSFKWGEIKASGGGVPRDTIESAVFRAAFLATGGNGLAFQRPERYSQVDGSGQSYSNTWFVEEPFAHMPTYISAHGPNNEWPGPSSLHPGMVNIVMVDGSARSLQESINWVVWLEMNGIADGQLPREDD